MLWDPKEEILEIEETQITGIQKDNVSDKQVIIWLMVIFPTIL